MMTNNATEQNKTTASAGDADSLIPSSEFLVRGTRFIDQGNMQDGVVALKQGAESGCVRSMDYYGALLYVNNGKSMAFPWILEAAIRGHTGSTRALGLEFYKEKPVALQFYWFNILQAFDGIHEQAMGEGLNNLCGQVMNKGSKIMWSKFCSGPECRKSHSDTVTLQKCGACEFYHYCSKECQMKHWKEGKHKGECKHLAILNKYHKPYAKEIREGSLRGDDSSTQLVLQKLRKKLGLTRPTSREEAVKLLRNENGNGNWTEYIAPRKDGTVCVGSTTKSI